MASKQNIIAGLDIGTTTVRVVLAEKQADGRLAIVGVGVSPSRGLRKGVVINIESTIESIAQAVTQAETMAGARIGSVIAALSGSHIKGLNSQGIVGIRHKEVSHQDIDKVIEAAKAVAIPLDREILHVLPQEFIIDEQDGIKEPLGISGVRLECKVHIVTGAVASAQNVVKCANRCGLAVKDVVIASLASARAVLTPEEQDLGIALLDIGGGTVDLIVFHAGAVKYTSVIPIGGNHISNDIAAGLRTPIGSAEEIKCRFGAAYSSMVDPNETIEVPSTGDRSSRTVSRVALAEIIEPRVNEIFSLVHKELVRSGMEELLTGGAVLTGGSSGLAGITQVAERVLGVPVRVGTPRGVVGLTDLVKTPEYATSVGLILQGAASEKQIHTRVSGGGAFSKATRKVANWFSEHF